MNDVDELLARAGERFREQITEPAVVTMPGQRPYHRRWAASMLATAAIAASVVGVIILPRVAPAPRETTVSGVPSSEPMTGTPDPLHLAPGAVAPSDAQPVTVTPQPAMPGERLVTEWRLLAIAHGGRRLYFAYGLGGGCDKLDHIQVNQEPAAVGIAPIIAESARPGAPCSAESTVGRGFVDLAQPLGQRALLHAPVTRGR